MRESASRSRLTHKFYLERGRLVLTIQFYLNKFFKILNKEPINWKTSPVIRFTPISIVVRIYIPNI